MMTYLVSSLVTTWPWVTQVALPRWARERSLAISVLLRLRTLWVMVARRVGAILGSGPVSMVMAGIFVVNVVWRVVMLTLKVSLSMT